MLIIIFIINFNKLVNDYLLQIFYFFNYFIYFLIFILINLSAFF